MTINNLKELKQIIQLCQKTGITKILVDNVELHISIAPKSMSKHTMDFSTDFPEANIQVPKYAPIPDGSDISKGNSIQNTADKIATDELTQEQLLFYSAQGHNE